MKFLLLSLCFSFICGKKESLSDLYSILDDSEILAMLQKRLKGLEDELRSETGCFDTSGTLGDKCGFDASNGSIIKTTESLTKGAIFLEQFSNVTCPRDCSILCCENPECDTSVYQDKVKLNSIFLSLLL